MFQVCTAGRRSWNWSHNMLKRLYLLMSEAWKHLTVPPEELEAAALKQNLSDVTEQMLWKLKENLISRWDQISFKSPSYINDSGCWYAARKLEESLMKVAQIRRLRSSTYNWRKEEEVLITVACCNMPMLRYVWQKQGNPHQRFQVSASWFSGEPMT